MVTQTSIIGDGCAAMMLASQADRLPDHNIRLIKPENAPPSVDHMWGFWAGKGLDEQISFARKKWNNWSIITESDEAVMSSNDHAYHAIHREKWLGHCREKIEKLGIALLEQNEVDIENDVIFDSRPPRMNGKVMLQHFYGIEVETKMPVFDDSKAILMDFRVDQSKGLHFIYLLPFSNTNALIESTIFSFELASEDFYLASIHDYLERIYSCSDFVIKHQEKGVIPMGRLQPHDPEIPGLGGNAGAIRPGSGYAFVYIHKQIEEAINHCKKTGKLRFKPPHKKIDLWMDDVMLTVLENYPNIGPDIFYRMGKSLSGDQFAKFMSGDITWGLRLKVITSMPKLPFIRGVTKRIFGGRSSGVA